MNFLENIDIYCERIDPSFWSEPLNAITNIAIFLAGLICFLQIRNLEKSNRKSNLVLQSIFAMITGIGSFLFHTFAVRWSMLADVIPIFCFQITAFYFMVKYIFKCSTILTLIVLIIFATLTIGLGVPPFTSYINGSLTYIPSLFFLILMHFYFVKNNQTNLKNHALLAWLSFFISVCARSIDMQVCNDFPYGTHFIWHTLNGVTIFILINTFRLYHQRSNS